MLYFLCFKRWVVRVLGSWAPNSWRKEVLPPAVCVLVVSPDNYVLAVSRKNDPNAWGFCGGKVDLDVLGQPTETLEQAIRRETREETGLELKNLTVLYEDSADQEFWTTCFVAEVTGIIKTEEAGKVAWVSWKTILSGPFGVYNKKVYNLFQQKEGF